MSLLADTLALFLALVLIASALHKFIQPGRLGAAAASLAGVSTLHGNLLAKAAATFEILAAAAMVAPPTRPAGAVAALALWAIYAILLARAVAHGAAFDCGCTLNRHQPGLGRLSPWPAMFLALSAGLLFLLPPTSGFELQTVLAACAFFSLCFATGEIVGARFNNNKAGIA
jgi:hypothetical protein